MLNSIVESLLLGLSVGPLCLAYCSPVLVPLLASSESSKISVNSNILISFLAGRLAGYMLIGVIVGLIGNGIKQFTTGNVLGIISIILGLILLYFSFQKGFPESKFCRFTKNVNSQKFFPLTLGFLTGLNLCPPFFAAIIGAANAGSIAGSILYFFMFFIGTVIFFPLFVLFGFLSKIEAVKAIADVCMGLSGIWFIFKGLLNII